MTTTGESIQVEGVVYRYRIASKTTATQKNVIEVTVEATNVTEKEQEEVKRKIQRQLVLGWSLRTRNTRNNK